MTSGTQMNLWTSANLFLYADKNGWEKLENNIVSAISQRPNAMNDALSGTEKTLCIRAHMYLGADFYTLSLSKDVDNLKKASIVAQKINEALISGKILIVQIYHSDSGPVGGRDWFTATFGAVTEKMQEVKNKYLSYDMKKDELKVKIDEIAFILDEIDSTGVK